jgi:hypothetical protein
MMGLDGIEWDYVNQDMKHHCIIRNVAQVAKINGVFCFLFEFNSIYCSLPPMIDQETVSNV